MTIEITPTREIVDCGGQPCHIWRGTTDKGIECYAFIPCRQNGWYKDEAKLWIEPTETVRFNPPPPELPYRVWTAATRFDIRGSICIHRVSVNERDFADFDRELCEMLSPGREADLALVRLDSHVSDRQPSSATVSAPAEARP